MPTDGVAAHGACRNCAAPLSGPYCAQCGQAAHVHRTLASLGHDLLHGVFHFEGKVWRTLPELFLRPGRLTRRYIDGERAKFVSPMALFLFAVFAMFAVFSFTGGAFLGGGGNAEGVSADRPALEAKIATTRADLARPDLSPARRQRLEKRLQGFEDDLDTLKALEAGDTAVIAGNAFRKGNISGTADVNTGWKLFDDTVSHGLQEAQRNPELLFYKLKAEGYKFAWALIPISLPFVWLLFFWRRDIPFYDHAVFTTYSLSFMLLLLVILSLATVIGIPGGIIGAAAAFVPPAHLYVQLRGSYRLGPIGAFIRIGFLLCFCLVALFLFTALLLALGLLG